MSVARSFFALAVALLLAAVCAVAIAFPLWALAVSNRILFDELFVTIVSLAVIFFLGSRARRWSARHRGQRR